MEIRRELRCTHGRVWEDTMGQMAGYVKSDDQLGESRGVASHRHLSFIMDLCGRTAERKNERNNGLTPFFQYNRLTDKRVETAIYRERHRERER